MPKTSSSLLKRRLEIAEIVRRQGEIKVDDLSEQLGVSGVTIRSDLNYLEQQGYLKRSFGGAIYTAPQVLPHAAAEVPAIAKQNIAIDIELARQCCRLITDRDSLFLGHGGRLRKVIPLLSPLKQLRVIVNDLRHALLAEEFINGDIVVAGSDLIPGQGALSGKALESLIQQLSISHCIIEASAVDSEGNFSTDLAALQPYYQQLLDKAQHTALVIYEAAVDRPVSRPIGHLHDVNCIITRRSTSDRYQQRLFESGFISSYVNNECVTWTNGNKIDK